VEKGKKCRIYNEENVRGNSEGGVMGHGFRFSVAKKRQSFIHKGKYFKNRFNLKFMKET